MAADPIRGKSIRWTYTEGPTKGPQFEHDFGTDGTVVWRMLGQKPASQNGETRPERPKYEVEHAGEDVWVVSYLAPSGWTLTTTLDFDEGRIVSIASNEKQLFVQRGTFEVLTKAKT